MPLVNFPSPWNAPTLLQRAAPFYVWAGLVCLCPVPSLCLTAVLLYESSMVNSIGMGLIKFLKPCVHFLRQQVGDISSLASDIAWFLSKYTAVRDLCHSRCLLVFSHLHSSFCSPSTSILCAFVFDHYLYSKLSFQWPSQIYGKRDGWNLDIEWDL